jgi:hypothetical protein
MQQMNCIHLSWSDYPAISSSVILPTPAPDLKNSRDTASIVVSLCANNALPLPCAAEHNLPQADENVGIPAEFLNASQSLPEKKWQKATSLCGYLLVVRQCKKANRTNSTFGFADTHKPNEKSKEIKFCQRSTETEMIC